jgi:hypothetical protein
MPVPAEFAAWVKQWQRGVTKAFHENLLKAVKACEELRMKEGDDKIGGNDSEEWVPFFKNDMQRKQWLAAAGHDRDAIAAAMQLYNGREVEAYEGLWKLVRPHGRDDRFYVEGKGE